MSLCNASELLGDIRELFPNKAIDLFESIELLQTVLNDTIKEISDKTSEKVLERKFNDLNKLTKIAEALSGHEDKLIQILSVLEIESNEDFESVDEIEEKRGLPNYDEYLVDSKVEHTLYENFTHIRPYGFKISDNKIIEAKTWQEMLIRTCELLIAIDKDKFLAFEHNKSMNGKKNKYFSKNESMLRKPGSISNEMFIELNQSSNSIRNFIVKLLKEYDFKVGDYKVYYRADYTNLK
ncbi:hypothetical protein ACR6HW_09360 [Fusibacter sp. JL298sf-3]